MPRVNQRTKSRAGKDRFCGRCGRKIEVGEPYFNWSFRYGGSRFACKDHRPRASELTQSKLSTVYGAAEDAEDALATAEADDFEGIVQAVGETAQEIADEYREAAENFGGEGENAERADELESWAEELNSWSPTEEPDPENPDDPLEALRAEASEVISSCPL